MNSKTLKRYIDRTVKREMRRYVDFYPDFKKIEFNWDKLMGLVHRFFGMESVKLANVAEYNYSNGVDVLNSHPEARRMERIPGFVGCNDVLNTLSKQLKKDYHGSRSQRVKS